MEAAGVPSLPQKAYSFVHYMVKHCRFKQKILINILAHAKCNQEIIYKITHPYEEKPWKIYRDYFITDIRVQKGIHYWKTHQQALKYAYRIYGVPSEIIVAIIGIETNYGQCIGNYSALDVLTTLAFYHQFRTKFFLSELVQLFLLAKEQDLPIYLIRSSYAGAIGISQFMPSTYRHYATKYPRNHYLNLMRHNNDAIVSVANFLHIHGWKKNQPVAYIVNHPHILIADKKALLSIKKKQLKAYFYLRNTDISSIIEIKSSIPCQIKSNHKYFWFLFPNFYVIMRYNPHVMYAMAVYQLSQAIREQYNKLTN
ncbi:lytic murein transglycosylase B [Coxiella endosymbiont of Amblyomma americanum]|uniref:lytic murein transglycosylase B n=1 Tax=Coxiella endosymbiont of Amblyomma americanum TaxID=325775 RepID=UPI001438F504|nr:lytic murein transglycosylase B [Coxiella endosymbiont of Amblyomma americanum]